MNSNASRLHNVHSLSNILPSGTEGGKEFARIVGLLLFQDARRQGREFNLFDDSSGDYEGLDGFSRAAKGDKIIGYQYKFFPSPLSDQHRAEIRGAVAGAAARKRSLTLEKYVVVTPDDLKNSARRAKSGDVTWFENLHREFKYYFELEHVGHSKIQDMFLQAPHLCLYYYPSLVSSGLSRRKTIQELRNLYDISLKSRYGRIEFVGMSVYKEEASRRIPLENIYIPLSVVPERAPDETEETPRANPISFLTPGARTVILGDPGSGKSTLMAFLALRGISDLLQKRCHTAEDNRLTIVVTLRRYADELKERRNLSILDYMVEVTKADFNIDAIDKGFFEFYLESGRAILLFDGLDELPGSNFKSLVRKRIESYSHTYPGNTIIITSRIVGYEAEVRFDESYAHFRVAKLRIPEIKRFIIDWYAARIEEQADRDRNASDLVNVITTPDNDAIRDLARNPLLLTIVTLVHRIDAVLPDQRVILYQKCTETLLNTWHKAKKRDEELAKGRIERRNRLRVEALAYWMHRRSLQESGRAVVPYSEMLSFLTKFIQDNEPFNAASEPAEDQAEIFLDFIKSGAGLIIEAGDGQYSFIHLTFQEYLSATHLTSNGEIGGTVAIWNELGGDLDNPRWREVVRLLVASLRSTQGQKFFIERLLLSAQETDSRDSILLLLGLLRDGIEPAEEAASVIVMHALRASLKFSDINDLRTVCNALKAWIDKTNDNVLIVESVMEKIDCNYFVNDVLALALTRVILGLPPLISENLIFSCSDSLPQDLCATYCRLILRDISVGTAPNWRIPVQVYDFWATENPEGNVAAVAGLGISILIDSKDAPTRLLHRELIMTATVGYGPHRDHFMNLLAVALPKVKLPASIMKALRQALSGDVRSKKVGTVFSRLLPNMNGMFISDDNNENEALPGMTSRVRDNIGEKIDRDPTLKDLSRRNARRIREVNETRELKLIRESFALKMEIEPSSYWRMVLESELYEQLIFPSILSYVNLEPKVHWQQALLTALETRVPFAFAEYLAPEAWENLEHRLREGSNDSSDLDFAAWLILLDVWTWEHDGYSRPQDSPFHTLAEVARGISYAPIELAVCVRGICLGDPTSEIKLKLLTTEQNSPLAKLLYELGWPRPGTKFASVSRVRRSQLIRSKPAKD